MIGAIITVIIILSLIWLFVHTKPNEIMSYKNISICKTCGHKKGILKCVRCKI